MQELRMTNDLEDAINLAWNNANELLEVLDSEGNYYKNDNLKEYVKIIKAALHDYAFYSVRTD